MTKNVILTAIILIINSLVQAQSYSIQRGHFDDDLYVYCRKNATSNSPYQLYYLTQFGQDLKVKYTIEASSATNDINLKNMVPDPNPGVLFCTSLSNADSAVYSSSDFGKSWLHLGARFNGLTPPMTMAGGAVSGEILFTEREMVQLYNISSTTNSFVTHSTNASYNVFFGKLEAGFAPGELFGINNAYTSNHDFLLHSDNYGVTIDTIRIDSVVVYNPNGNQALKVCRGTAPGELFLITQEAEQAGFPHVFKIYHSANYGETYTFMSEFKFDENSSATEFTGGRAGCSFYVVNWEFNQSLQRQIMQVYYSSDCAHSFVLHEFDLDDYVNTPKTTTAGELEFSPNPANDITTISIPGANLRGKAQLTVRNANGSIALIKNFSAAQPYKLDVATLRSGMYLLELKCSGQMYTGQLIKQ